MPKDTTEDVEEQIIPTSCASHCGGTCLLKVHVKNGIITRIETDNEEEPQLRACFRGRAYRQRVYAEDRILYPMRRVDDKGKGKFQRISWDEALDSVARELIRVRESYGPEAVIYISMGGDLTSLHTYKPMNRLLSMSGGCTVTWGVTSFQGGIAASLFSYGTMYASNTRDDLLNSRLIIMWGWDPASSFTGTNTTWFLAQAKERGIRIIVVDPRYSDSAAVFVQEWIPIRPGTDCAALIAMAYVIIKENLQDQRFLNTYTVGFDKYRDYVLGMEDGIAKTPAWAEAITGMPAATIERLAREYATTKPAALMAGIAPGRTAFGEQYHRASITLAAMTGNVGIHGGDAGARAWESIIGGYPYPVAPFGGAIKGARNPVEVGSPPSPKALLGYRYPRLHYSQVADAVLKGRAGGYPADYKLLYMVNTNFLNSFPNINKIVKALKEAEFIVLHEQFMTPTAKFADILLPNNTYMERNDIALGVGTAYYGYQNKVIEPLGESKSQLEIASALAARLGISDYDTGTEEELLRRLAEQAHIPNYEAFKKAGIYKPKQAEPYVAFRKQIEDPENNPFPTPSGKIEIYSQQMADINDPLCPPIPKYIETWESCNDPLAQKYPIQLITNHAKRRALAQFETLPWLRELIPQAIVINTADAKARGIRDGDRVRVFNDRGETLVQAQVTKRIMPGVANLPSGAWYNPDETGLDRGGSANVLTSERVSPCGSFTYNTLLVQIEKVGGG